MKKLLNYFAVLVIIFTVMSQSSFVVNAQEISTSNSDVVSDSTAEEMIVAESETKTTTVASNEETILVNAETAEVSSGSDLVIDDTATVPEGAEDYYEESFEGDGVEIDDSTEGEEEKYVTPIFASDEYTGNYADEYRNITVGSD
ncbi:MAG: hypothetical protein IJP17_03640, partial [Clostridia bacterium]|nr:hypothetical protein [Clostridia bacterium]